MTGLGTGGPPARVPDTPEREFDYDELADGELIGQGGNADVYRVTVTRDGREIPVAVKQPRLQGTMHPETVERFVEEAEVWTQFDDHDHVVSLFDRGTEPLPWLAMEYMDGASLEDVLSDGPLPPAQAAWVGICVCNALNHAHRRGVAHLDLKPANILFRQVDNAWMVPKISDWGLARMLLEETGSIEGLSPHYAAPEQFDPDTHGSPDDRTDIYQLGAVLYELFTGRPPFDGSPAAVMNGVLNEQPASPSDIANVPPQVDDILQPALTKDKSDRYESILYLRDEFDQLFERTHNQREMSTTTPASTSSSASGQTDTYREQESTPSTAEEHTTEASTATDQDPPSDAGDTRAELSGEREMKSGRRWNQHPFLATDTSESSNSGVRSIAVTGLYGFLGIIMTVVPTFIVGSLPGPIYYSSPRGSDGVEIFLPMTIVGNLAMVGGLVVLLAAGLRAVGYKTLAKGLAVFGSLVFLANFVLMFIV